MLSSRLVVDGEGLVVNLSWILKLQIDSAEVVHLKRDGEVGHAQMACVQMMWTK